MHLYIFCIFIQDQEVTHRGSINLGGNQLNERCNFNNLDIKSKEKVCGYYIYEIYCLSLNVYGNYTEFR